MRQTLSTGKEKKKEKQIKKQKQKNNFLILPLEEKSS